MDIRGGVEIPKIQVDILPERVDTQVKCLPKMPENDWNCCREHSTC
jgi:hypothetical protein